ncbi:MAG: hypothetical protein ACT4PV_12250 [Planctomycetaceae bacterium]
MRAYRNPHPGDGRATGCAVVPDRLRLGTRQPSGDWHDACFGGAPGHFLAPPEAGVYRVVAEKSAYLNAMQEVRVEAGEVVSVNLTLDRGQALIGRVVDSVGRPLAAMEATFEGPGGCEQAAWTDEGGFFRIDGLAAGLDGRLLVTDWEGRYVDWAWVGLVPHEGSFTIALRGAARMRGRVVPLPADRKLQCRVKSIEGLDAREVELSAEGGFDLGGAPEKRPFELVLYSDTEGIFESGEISLASGEARHLGLCSSRPLSGLSGRVTWNDARPIADAMVVATHEGFGIASFAVTGLNGEFKFEKWVPGTTELCVFAHAQHGVSLDLSNWVAGRSHDAEIRSSK